MAKRDEIAKLLHETRMKLCWGKNVPSNKQWPENDRDLRERMYHGDPMLDQAYAETDALLLQYDVTMKPTK